MKALDATQGRVLNDKIPTVIDRLDSTSGSALYATQGKILNDKIEAKIIPDIANNLTTTTAGMTLDATQGKAL